MRKTSPFLKGIDSFELEARFSTESAIKYQDMRESNVTYEELMPFLSKLPEREQDLIELYYRYRKNQKDIAKMFGVTQGAISSRLSRAMKRLKFIRDLPKIEFEDIDSDLSNYFDGMEIEIIKCMMETTCQSKT
ncbi:MAG TPA: sigma-70 family RNA polymerase sigma factor, partial [Candidatus Paceibacterota bacterium]|nr:sigma-70 family RNA polymerase sigma factor [Candidatus Paceibacterota bacterium]